MLMVLNTRGFDHKKAYGYDRIIMDASNSQIERAKVGDPKSVISVVRFSYAPNEQVIIEKFQNISVQDTITKNFDFQDDEEGILFFGDCISTETVNKDSAAILYPKAFNKLGNFNQFTLKWA
ncbi:hypothetical protein [Vibrio vulnificus]|uniref:hypothetical protein n=1 Tax=Vibrio vulnificus TaxID=672 RepID=UPI0009B70136|nr:hypothetical protein [Vibrio vulnificus]OQK34491.1 hypothetical protein XM74_u0076 [Vibrio vulnificus]POC21340.1 hypothetical protein CRN46_14905 [Vibrio vulnificus]